METVTAANSAKYYRGQGRAPSEASEVKNTAGTASIHLDQASIADQVVLSTGARGALQSIEGKLSDIVEEHPQYAHHFPNSDGELRLMGQLRSFIKSPSNQHFAATNPNFHKFYKKVEALGAHLTQTMARMREESKSGDSATYHGLV